MDRRYRANSRSVGHWRSRWRRQGRGRGRGGRRSPSPAPPPSPAPSGPWAFGPYADPRQEQHRRPQQQQQQGWEHRRDDARARQRDDDAWQRDRSRLERSRQHQGLGWEPRRDDSRSRQQSSQDEENERRGRSRFARIRQQQEENAARTQSTPPALERPRRRFPSPPCRPHYSSRVGMEDLAMAPVLLPWPALAYFPRRRSRWFLRRHLQDRSRERQSQSDDESQTDSTWTGAYRRRRRSFDGYNPYYSHFYDGTPSRNQDSCCKHCRYARQAQFRAAATPPIAGAPSTSQVREDNRGSTACLRESRPPTSPVPGPSTSYSLACHPSTSYAVAPEARTAGNVVTVTAALPQEDPRQLSVEVYNPPSNTVYENRCTTSSLATTAEQAGAVLQDHNYSQRQQAEGERYSETSEGDGATSAAAAPALIAVAAPGLLVASDDPDQAAALAGKRQVPGLSPNGTTIRLGQLPDTPELLRLLGLPSSPGFPALPRGAPPGTSAARVAESSNLSVGSDSTAAHEGTGDRREPSPACEGQCKRTTAGQPEGPENEERSTTSDAENHDRDTRVPTAAPDHQNIRRRISALTLRALISGGLSTPEPENQLVASTGAPGNFNRGMRISFADLNSGVRPSMPELENQLLASSGAPGNFNRGMRISFADLNSGGRPPMPELENQMLASTVAPENNGRGRRITFAINSGGRSPMPELENQMLASAVAPENNRRITFADLNSGGRPPMPELENEMLASIGAAENNSRSRRITFADLNSGGRVSSPERESHRGTSTVAPEHRNRNRQTSAGLNNGGRASTVTSEGSYRGRRKSLAGFEGHASGKQPSTENRPRPSPRVASEGLNSGRRLSTVGLDGRSSSRRASSAGLEGRHSGRRPSSASRDGRSSGRRDTTPSSSRRRRAATVGPENPSRERRVEGRRVRRSLTPALEDLRRDGARHTKKLRVKSMRLLMQGDECGGVAGDSALHLATRAGDVEAVQALLDAEGDGDGGLIGAARALRSRRGRSGLVRARNSQQQTALHVAAAGGHEAILRLLLGTETCGVNDADANRDTALHLAARADCAAACAALLRHGASRAATNASRRTAADEARAAGAPSAARALAADPHRGRRTRSRSRSRSRPRHNK